EHRGAASGDGPLPGPVRRPPRNDGPIREGSRTMRSDQAIVPAEEQTRLSTADVAASGQRPSPPVVDRPADDLRADNGRTEVENHSSVPACNVKKPAESGSAANGKDSTAPLFARQEADEM